MSFKFSLQKILELREEEVNLAQTQFNLAQNKILQLKTLLESERHLYFSDREELNTAVKKVEFTEIQIFEKSLTLRQTKMMELLKNLREVQKEKNEKENILIQAKLNKKVIEKLYQIKEKEFEKKELMREQYLLDEIAILNHKKNNYEEENE
jgi:flagellar FliJ protein